MTNFIEMENYGATIAELLEEAGINVEELEEE